MEQLEEREISGVSPEPVGSRRRRRRRRPKWRRALRRVSRSLHLGIILLTIGVIVVIVGVTQAVLIADAGSQLRGSWTTMSRVLDTVSNKTGTELTLADFSRLEAGVNDLADSLSSLRQRVAYVEPVTRLNNEWEVQLTMADAAQALTWSTRDILAGLQPALTYMVAGDNAGTVATQISSGERIVELLSLGRGRFISADSHLTNARSIIDSLPLTELSPGLLLSLGDMEDYYSQIADINALLLEMPDVLSAVLGLDETVSYLILAQNSDELRPSGGYISTYGWMTVRNGRVVDYSYSPTTTTSPFPPGQSFLETLEIPDWWIRYREPIFAAWDGSWYADFPSTAELARSYYDAGANPQSPITGVIAIDIVGFEYIMEALQAVPMPEYGVVVRPDNFRELVYDIRAFGEGEVPHKRFVAAIYEQIFSEWQEIGRDEQTNSDLLGLLLKALQEKHIMVYFADESLNESLSILDWSGVQSPATNSDYLMVADANMGNKSNRSVLRQLTYDVQIRNDDTLQGRVTISYDYPSSLAESDPAVDAEYHGPLDYNTIMQVFVPAQSRLTAFDDLPRDPELVYHDAHTAFVSRVEIPYDEARRFQFTYETPPLIDTVAGYNRYRLLLQKQPGMLSEPASVQITMPPGVTIIDTSPAPAATYSLESLVLDFRLDLTTDEWIEIIYQE
jgi:hypothetical protein